MRIGVNCLSSKNLPIIRQLYAEGIADFCEIAVDNFAHLPASMIKDELPCVPLTLHFVASRFLEKSKEELSNLATWLRPWVDALNPLYISDHLIQFAEPDGRRLPMIRELNYIEVLPEVTKKVIEWQALLERQIYFENHASMSNKGKDQPYFFDKLIEATDAGLLFDFSNAYIAQYNQTCEINTWHLLIKDCTHFHVAGFRVDPETHLAIDTHDTIIHEDVLQVLRQYIVQHDTVDQTIVFELDTHSNYETLKQQLLHIKRLQKCTPN